MKENKIYLPFVIIIGVISISFAGPVTSIISMPAVSIALIRLTFSFLILSPFFIRSIIRHRMPNVKLYKSTFIASIFLALHFVFWVSSLKYTSVTSSVVLVTTNPLFVGLFSLILLKEKPNKRLIVSIVVVIIGGIIISSGEEITPMKIKGNLLALLGAIMASLYILTGRVIRQEFTLVEYTTPLYFFTSAILLFAAIVLDTKILIYPINNYLLILFLAIVPQLLGHNAFNWALKFLSPTVIALLILFEPIGATIISFFMFGYVPSILETIGSLVILVGIIISII